MCPLATSREAQYFSTNVTTANNSAFGAPYFISVSLKIILPCAMRTFLPFHSCSWCSYPEMATTEASVLGTYMPFTVGMPSTGASHSSCFIFLKASWALSFQSISCCNGRICLRILLWILDNNLRILGSSWVACPFWGPSMLTRLSPHSDPAS